MAGFIPKHELLGSRASPMNKAFTSDRATLDYSSLGFDFPDSHLIRRLCQEDWRRQPSKREIILFYREHLIEIEDKSEQVENLNIELENAKHRIEYLEMRLMEEKETRVKAERK